MKRYLILVACVVILVSLGTNQAWSVFIVPLKDQFGFSDTQMQSVFGTASLVFCVVIIFGGRLQDRFGPRPLAAASAVMIAGAYWLAHFAHGNFFLLWTAMGVLAGAGASIGYLAPIATAMKWFPGRRGLVAGLMAAGFAVGPIIVSSTAETAFAHGWKAGDVFALMGWVYPAVILAAGMMLVTPAGGPGLEEVDGFQRRRLLVDRRFWTLCAGMFVGTLPFLVVMGAAEPLGQEFGLGEWAAKVIGLMAAGNAAGRIFWGLAVDRAGTRRSMLAAQAAMVVMMLALILLGQSAKWAFMVAACGIGFCYGSNFAIYPATVSHLYGTHVLGSVYPFVMLAQSFSSLAPALNGGLHDRTGSYIAGLVTATVIAAVGLAVCAILSRPAGGLAEDKRG